MNWGDYDHYGYAAIALVGTFVAAGGLLWLMVRSRHAGLLRSFHGVVPPFINIVGVLFALTLAFLANDTWNAHDRAINTVYREADSLNSLKALALKLPRATAERVDTAIDAYARSVVEIEWPLLGQRRSSPEAALRFGTLLGVLSGDDVASSAGASVHALMLAQAIDVRDGRELRIALSQTHVNPLKWLGMAFLGFLTMASVAIVHVEAPRAAFAAVMLFAVSAAPTAAIVLVQGNPFQHPSIVASTPIAGVYGPR
ncbi:MAG: DUF4239 domain-containing protein [Hyphomicrobiaceae bacterium]|nr:DUF4239 domain-containing protein [Hyphomicrobiaceae bacterium]